MSITETASSWLQPMCYNYCALLQTGIEWSASQMLNQYWLAHWLILLTKILCFKIATTCHHGLLSGFKNISYLGHFILARSEGISRSLKLLPVPVWEKKEALASWLLTLYSPTCPSLSSRTMSPLLQEEPWECWDIGHLASDSVCDLPSIMTQEGPLGWGIEPATAVWSFFSL